MVDTLVLLSLLASSVMTVRAVDRKPLDFSGEVESVDLRMGTVAVRHGAIPGYMPAMTMDYMVDDDSLLKQLMPSDRITATVYAGDPILHHIQIAGHGSVKRH